MIDLGPDGGAGSLEPAVRWATRSGALDLRSLEIVLRDDDTGAIVHNARRILTAVDQLVSSGELDDEVPVYVEPPRLYGAPPTPGWLGALDEIAAMDHRLKFRTGGADADAFPAAHELAASIEAAIDREVAFKCTAGLHNAVRHRDDETVEVNFAKVAGTPATSVVFVAAAFKKGTDFTKARNVSFKVYDSSGGTTEQVADIFRHPDRPSRDELLRQQAADQIREAISIIDRRTGTNN